MLNKATPGLPHPTLLLYVYKVGWRKEASLAVGRSLYLGT